MKKTIYHSNVSETRKGRIINALLALCTANRYSVIFSFKITIVKRNYQLEGMRKRAKENIFIALVLFPFVMALMMAMEKCKSTPMLPSGQMNDSTAVDTTEVSAGVALHPLHKAQGAELPLLHSTINQTF